jgi:predicted transposase/invertase (TIGR01784 family)
MKSQKHIRFDWAVKKMLRSKANFCILEGFLSELLREEINVLEILESEGNKETDDDKFNRVDILVKDSRSQLIIVEIQNTRELDYFYKILYNTAKAITEHMRSGSAYSDVKKVITVSVVYFDLGQGQDYIYYGNTSFTGIHRSDTLELSEKQKQMFKRQTVKAIFPEHYIIKVNEFNDIARDSLDEWIYFLKNSEIKDEFKAKGLSEAREKLKEINLPERELRAYKSYLEQLSYEASIAETIKFESQYDKQKAREEGLLEGKKEGLLEGKKKGLLEGKKEGKKEGKFEMAMQMAKALKEKGIDPQIISEASGLAKEEIETL